MDIKQKIEQRLESLNWTRYKLAKRVAATKAARLNEQPSAATRYHTAIGKALETPEKSKVETIQEIVEALGGTLHIVWANQTFGNALKKPYQAVTTTTTGKQLYLVKIFEKEGVRVNASTTFNGAISQLILGYNKKARAEIWHGNECLWSSENIQQISATLGYTVVAHTDSLPPDNSWLCFTQ